MAALQGEITGSSQRSVISSDKRSMPRNSPSSIRLRESKSTSRPLHRRTFNLRSKRFARSDDDAFDDFGRARAVALLLRE